MIAVLRKARRGPHALLDKRAAALAAEAMLQTLGVVHGVDGFELTIELVDDVEMAQLHGEYLGRVGPTNVLSFEPGDAASESAGLVILSLETAAREAFFYGQDPTEHALRLLAHGVLHTMGFDHGPVMDDATEACMDAGMTALEVVVV